MLRLFNKHIIVAISGGIAAYKSAELVRLLKAAGAQVKVVMTKGAVEFITPLTLQALSGNPVHQHLLGATAEAGMDHIQLARWADTIMVAPCTAQVMARLAQGQADDLLSTLCLATPAPVLLAPAMNQAMWGDPATQANAQLLIERGFALLGPDIGEQACGDVGPGRMLEPNQLVAELEQVFVSHILQGRKVVITAGPTREAIDPVRYLSNHSSGKMGYALAQAAVEAGAQVHLISGPTALPTPMDLQCTQVQNARDMLSACQSACQDADVFIASAAVADYRPAKVAKQKMKKSGAKSNLSLELVQNPDILATIAADCPQLTCVGFAAETQQLVAHAQAKLERKQVAMIISNDVSEPGIGFNSDENQVYLVTAGGAKELPRLSKTQLARQLINHIAQLNK